MRNSVVIANLIFSKDAQTNKDLPQSRVHLTPASPRSPVREWYCRVWDANYLDRLTVGFIVRTKSRLVHRALRHGKARTCDALGITTDLPINDFTFPIGSEIGSKIYAKVVKFNLMVKRVVRLSSIVSSRWYSKLVLWVHGNPTSDQRRHSTWESFWCRIAPNWAVECRRRPSSRGISSCGSC